MTTQAQIDANRRNAQRSTGPSTAAGKARVSRNAITHGLDCRDVVLPGENRAGFEHYRRAMIADHQPFGAEEQDCVERMVAAQWRTQRLWRAEGQIHAQASRRLGFQADVGTAILFDAQNEKALAYLDRKEAGLTREYHRSSRRLQELQDQRRQGTRHVIEEEEGAAPDAAAANATLDGTPPPDRASGVSAEQTQSAPDRAAPLPSAGQPTVGQGPANGSGDTAIGNSAEQSQSGRTPRPVPANAVVPGAQHAA